jgi:hypothetical protein
MKNLIYLFVFIPLLTVPVFAQSAHSDEDPFKRDPIFNKSLDELFGNESDEEMGEESDDIQHSSRVIKKVSRNGIDLGGGLEAGPYYSNELYNQYPNLPMIHFNRVNGLFIGIRAERMQWHRFGSFLDIPQIQPHGFIGYGTASKEWEYAIGLEKKIGESRRFMVGAEYHKATATEDYRRVGLTETSLTSFFAGYDFLDYYKQEGFGVYSVIRSERWIEAAFSYNESTFSTLFQETDYTMFGKSSVYRPNPAIDRSADEIDLGIYSFSLSLNPRDVLITNKFAVSSTLVAELADNSVSDENYRFNRYRGDVKIFYNFEPGSVLRWKVSGGRITGNVPDFKRFYLGGIGTLRGSPYKFFSGDEMVASNIEVQFGRPSTRAGQWYQDYHLHLLLFLDSGWTNRMQMPTSGRMTEVEPTKFSISNMQHDFGVGLGTGALRFELAWPLETFDSQPVFWVRFNPTF